MRKRTINYVIKVSPDKGFADGDPFGADTQWQIHIVNLVKGFPDQTVLAEGIWDFTFTFTSNHMDIELLKEPIKTKTYVNLPDGTEVQTDVTVKSVLLRPFGVTVYYGDESDGLDYERTAVYFTDAPYQPEPWYAAMKDGSKNELLFAGGNPIERYNFLDAEVPIALEQVDYILLSDGTKLPVPNQ